MQVPLIFRMVAILAATASILACSNSDGAPPQATLEASTSCAVECISREDAEKVLGFKFFEPAYLPPDFVLHQRSIPPVPESARPNSIQIEYRFLGSRFVPALHVLQEAVPSVDEVTLSRADTTCGEFITLASGDEVFYTEGIGGLRGGLTEDEYLVCPEGNPPPLAMGHVYMVRGNVVIHILGLPESGLDKNDLLMMAESLHN